MNVVGSNPSMHLWIGQNYVRSFGGEKENIMIPHNAHPKLKSSASVANGNILWRYLIPDNFI